MSQRWQAVGNTVSDLTGPRFEPQTFHSRDERVTARTGQLVEQSFNYFWCINALMYVTDQQYVKYPQILKIKYALQERLC